MKSMVFVFILLILPLASAAIINIDTEFDQGETLIAKVSGNFVEPPLKENIDFYRGHVKVPMDFEIGKIDYDYYIYAKLPENNANYSIKIDNINYYKGTQIIDEPLSQNFSISNKTADFSIEPGFVIADENFYIQTQNLQEYEITIKIKTATTSGTSKGFFSSLFGEINDDENNSISLKSGEIKKINFDISGVTDDTIKTIWLSTDDLEYEIPVYIFGVDKTSENETGKEDLDEFEEENGEEISDGEVSDDGEEYISETTKTCVELDGTICRENEECEGEEVYAKDDKCCLVPCKAKSTNSTGKIIGLILIVVIIGFLIWFYQTRYRGKTKKKINLLDVAKGKKK